MLDVCQEALKPFADMGCTVEEASAPASPEAAWRAFQRLRHWQAGGNLLVHYRDPASRALMKPEAVWEVEEGLKLGAFDISAAQVARTVWSNAVCRLFDRFDCLIAPTAQVFPFDLNERWPCEIAGQAMATYHEWMKAVCLITMAGCPSLAAPAGFGAAGLPMGIQIIAPVGGEMDCLRLAFAHEAATRWVSRRPPPQLG